MRATLIAVLIFLAIGGFVYAQQIEIRPCKLERHHFSKIYGSDDSTNIILAGKINDHFTNFIYTSHPSLLSVTEGKVFDSFFRADGNYFFSLNGLIYSCYLWEGSGKRFSKFYIDHVVYPNGTQRDTDITLFDLDSHRFGKLNSESNGYRIIQGTSGNKILATYNNDYTEMYPEGFRYRILQGALHLSPVDSIILPYNDRICNINSTIYDDKEENIYMLCEIFRFVDKKRRVTDHFSVFKYNIPSGTLIEGKANNMPDSSNCQMQIGRDAIYLLNFQSPDFIKESDSLNLYKFNKQTLNLESVHLNRFNKEFVRIVNKKDVKYSFKFFKPADFVIVNDTSLLSIYEYQFNSSNISEGAITASVIGSVVGLAALGMTGFGFFVMPAGNGELIPYTGDLLLMSIDSSGSFNPFFINKEPLPRQLNNNSFAVINDGNNIHLLYNNYSLLGKKHLPKITDLKFNLQSKELSIDTMLFANNHVTYLENSSMYSTGKDYYFMGDMSVPGKDSLSNRKRSDCIMKYFPEK